MGRKSALTKLIQSQIVEILEAGNYQKTAYESLGIPKATYDWLKEGEKAESKEEKLTKKEKVYIEFLESIKKAVQVARQKNLQCIQDATEERWGRLIGNILSLYKSQLCLLYVGDRAYVYRCNYRKV